MLQTLRIALQAGKVTAEMGRLDYKVFYRRNLPHFQPTGTTLFLTFRLIDSIPQTVLHDWAQEEVLAEREKRSGLRRGAPAGPRNKAAYRKRFLEYENLLDRAVAGPTWLSDSSVADIVSDALRFRDSKVFRLDAYSIMPNHVHAVFAPLPKEGEGDHSLASIMHSLKSYTANKANKKLNRRGGFWEHENYDHAVRDEEEWFRIVAYVLNNPVKAGLAKDWREWKHSYSRIPW